MSKQIRSKWKTLKLREIRWDESVFNNLERFVDKRPQQNIEKFKITGDIHDLFENETPSPEPFPSQIHQKYMQFYANHKY